MIKRKITAEKSKILKKIRRKTLEKKDSLTWEEDGMVYMEGRIYVPNNRKIKEDILKENHDSVDIGYPRQHRMMKLLKRTYWWPELKKDIKKYVQECFKCQQNKVQH